MITKELMYELQLEDQKRKPFKCAITLSPASGRTYTSARR